MKKTIIFMLSIAISCITSAQNINLSGVSNARQLGGYIIGDKTIKQDVLIRSANLSLASDSDINVLHDKYHVAQLFDFRSTLEHESAPNRIIADCEYHWLPCLDKAVKDTGLANKDKEQKSGVGDIRKTAEAVLDYIDNPQMKQMADYLYQMIVFDEEVQRHYSTFLHTLAILPEGRAALWHCTQGKDRTGCASAFLLAALGADRKLIVEDFARSNASYQPLIDELIAKAKERGTDESKFEIIYALIGVSVKNFERTLDSIDKRYGSLDNYLTQALHCDESLRNALRARYLE